MTYVQASGYDSNGQSIAWASWTDSPGDPHHVPDPLSTACGWVVEQVTVRGAASAVAFNDAGEELVRHPDAVTCTSRPIATPAENLPNSLRGLGPMPAPFTGRVDRQDSDCTARHARLPATALVVVSNRNGDEYVLTGEPPQGRWWCTVCPTCGGMEQTMHYPTEMLRVRGPFTIR